jgi:flagellar protein FliS
MGGKQDMITEKAARRYREEHVSGLSQKELILMLYDGAIKFAAEAKDAIEAKDFARSYTSIVKARDIVTELLCILNMEQGGEVGVNLERLYIYVIGRLTEANFTQEIPLLDNVVAVLGNLRSAWADLDFEQAMAAGVPGNGKNGSNGATKLSTPRRDGENSRILSVTI